MGVTEEKLAMDRGSKPETTLSPEELQRYARHLVLPEVGLEGQERLKAASVLLVGAGGLGSPLALYLAAAGVGRIGLCDFDVVDAANLQRQVLYGTGDLGRPKLDAAGERLADLNPHLQLDRHPVRLASDNALGLLEPYDIVIDGTDNFPTRYLVNDACVLLRKPNVYGSIFRFEGQVSVFHAGRGPCYRCLYPEPPPPGLVPNCAEGGVLGILPGVVGALQATEAIKLILGKGDSLLGRLLLFDALEMRFRELGLRRDPDCPVCGETPTIDRLIDYERFCGVAPAPAPAAAGPDADIDVLALKQRLDRGEDILLLDVREPYEWLICRLDDAVHIPLRDVPARLGELDASRETVVYCRTGVRSARVVELLRRSGFRRARNLVGGLHAWSAEVDPTVPRY
jgi:adenylyltransferase/sulfurtransferase